MSPKLSDEFEVDLGSKKVRVRFTRHDRARRIIIRLDQTLNSIEDGVVVTLPVRVSINQGLEFVRDKADWILKRLGGLNPRITLANGAVVPLGGISHVICHTEEKRGLVRVKEQKILVSGGIEHLERRVRDWLKVEARSRIQFKVYKKAITLGCKPGKITIRDTRSRWGSCSYNGNLSFSWRLVMAPENILDYVVAHEVSHLIEHNHGYKFWQIVSCLTEDVAKSKEWLKTYGEGLHRIG